MIPTGPTANLHALKRNRDGLVELAPNHFIPEPKEDDEQKALIAHCRAPDTVCAFPGAERLYSTRNGIPLRPVLRIKNRQMGLTPGIPDLHLPVSRGGHPAGEKHPAGDALDQRPVPFHSLYIELKRLVTGSPSDEEVEWLTFLRCEGNAAFIAHGRWEAWAIIRWYLEGAVAPPDMTASPVKERWGRTLLVQRPMRLDFSLG